MAPTVPVRVWPSDVRLIWPQPPSRCEIAVMACCPWPGRYARYSARTGRPLSSKVASARLVAFRSVWTFCRHFGVAEPLLELGTTDQPTGRSLTASSSALKFGARVAACVEVRAVGGVVAVGELLPHAASSMPSAPAMTPAERFIAAPH